ncbi:gp1 [Sphingomonas phage PAU]|uniref:RNA polymerase sigma factor n=1 Tax=Sphingomonas phage PAU TaxID=1150991 RepID=UPI000257310D|nr:RNA polymerase sigma factor [Sphingomonas phage PAU]AFF28006.1 gp1 [Sphingomonas phage PAU]
MAQFNSASIGLYLKDFRKINRTNLNDKFSNDSKYNALYKAWQKAEDNLLANPKNANFISIELKRRSALEDYINDTYSQKELAALPLAKNKGNRNREIENCLGLVYSMALYYAKNSKARVGFEDLIAYGNLGLVVAADKYFTTEVPSESILRLRSKGFAKFSTYAYAWIKKYIIEGSHEMGAIVGGSSRTKEEANRNAKIITQNYSSDEGDDMTDVWDYEMNKKSVNDFKELKIVEDDVNELKRYVKVVFAPLTKYEKRILFMALGIDTPNGVVYKMNEIAKIMNVSKPTISRDIARAYNKLRTQASQKLHGEDAVTMAALILGTDLTDVNLPELRMESTEGFENGPKNVKGSNLIKAYRQEW